MLQTASPLIQNYYSESELAEHLGKTTRTLFEWRRRGYGPPATMIGRVPHYRKAAVQQWLDEMEEK
ncbi:MULTISPECIES: helix-turn-helix domain-containing protein [unclassified Bradyrhizobium]|nr:MULTISPECIES: helix-turn-helix domain-containing protein [unclassified Bradyrhizobium]